MKQTNWETLFNILSEAAKCSDMEAGKDSEDSELFRLFDLSTESGNAFYSQLTDEQLLQILRDKAMELNHSPAQKEIFWIWRMYLRQRFEKWPYALKAAGLRKSAGSSGKTMEEIAQEDRIYRELLCELQKKAQQLGRIPHPKDVPELCSDIKKHRKNWDDVIRDAGLDQDRFFSRSNYRISDLENEYRWELDQIQKLAQRLGRPPLRIEVEEPVRKHLIARCGSWRNALYQIDLEPVMRIHPFSSTNLYSRETSRRNHRVRLRDCYYRILNPDQQLRTDLHALSLIRAELNHDPAEKEVPGDLKKRLILGCGSWQNALHQLQYSAVSPGKDGAVKKVVEEKISLFGSVGKAGR